MAIRVVVAGATGWTGSAVAKAILGGGDFVLAGAVARSAAGKDVGEVLGLPKDAADERNAILEIRAGTGGDEASLFAGDLFRMYERYAARQGWRVEVVSASEGEVGGFKEIVASVAGKGVFAAGNFSVTAALLKRFAASAAKYVRDVEIIDYAYQGKPDTPSGTARELAEQLSLVRQPGTAKPVAELSGLRETRGAAIGEKIPVQVHSVRLPGFVLGCEALFGAPDERLTIRHDAGASAAPYVGGTLLAVRRVGEQAGLRRGLDTLLD